MCFLPLLNFRKTFLNSSQCCRWLIVKCVYLARFLGHPFLGLLFLFFILPHGKICVYKTEIPSCNSTSFCVVLDIFLLSFFVVVAVAVLSVIPNAKLLFLSIVIFTRHVCVCVQLLFFSFIFFYYSLDTYTTLFFVQTNLSYFKYTILANIICLMSLRTKHICTWWRCWTLSLVHYVCKTWRSFYNLNTFAVQ